MRTRWETLRVLFFGIHRAKHSKAMTALPGASKHSGLIGYIFWNFRLGGKSRGPCFCNTGTHPFKG